MGVTSMFAGVSKERLKEVIREEIMGILVQQEGSTGIGPSPPDGLKADVAGFEGRMTEPPLKWDPPSFQEPSFGIDADTP